MAPLPCVVLLTLIDICKHITAFGGLARKCLGKVGPQLDWDGSGQARNRDAGESS
jgi:hypothetical protein